jgi:hypothetical protein
MSILVTVNKILFGMQLLCIVPAMILRMVFIQHYTRMFACHVLIFQVPLICKINVLMEVLQLSLISQTFIRFTVVHYIMEFQEMEIKDVSVLMAILGMKC